MNCKPIYAEPRKGDIKHSYADILKAEVLGFKPRVSLEEGVRKLMETAPFKKSLKLSKKDRFDVIG